MDTEIKLRIWTGDKMEYDIVYGRFGIFYVNPGTKGDGLNEKDTASLTPFNTKLPKGTSIMRSTGFKDKNGVEIFESDIIRYVKRIERPGKESIFENHYYLVKMSPKGQWVAVRGAVGQALWNARVSHEVVGNLYENSDLIK